MPARERRMPIVAVLGLSLFCTDPGYPQPPADPTAPPPLPEGVEVQARGPVHEAYAGPVGEPQAAAVVPRQPPAPLEEMPAEQKPAGDNVQWIPGYWAWDSERNDFLWVSGLWRVPPPGRQWVTGRWNQVSGGWQWVPGLWQAQQVQQVTYLPPPPALPQVAPPPPAPNPDAVYVPGSWIWNGTRYAWRNGAYVTAQPGWVWMPPHYLWTPAGYVFVEGYWDYPLRERGLLFAPVVLNARFIAGPRFVYRPAFVVPEESLYGAFFVHPVSHHYYFGDYFEARYRNAGFVAWCDFRYGRFGFDPLFGYYRWHYRNDPRWVSDLHGVYVARFNGTMPRPAHTFVANVALGAGSGGRFGSVALVVPLAHVPRAGYRLEPVSREAQLRHLETARHLEVVSRERHDHESRIVAGGSAHAAAHVATFQSIHNNPVSGRGKPTVPPRPTTHRPDPHDKRHDR
jgi:hypothetical protein